MAMELSRDCSFALTVSADYFLTRYDLRCELTTEPVTPCVLQSRTKQAGSGAIAIRDDGKVCAIGGWDGKIRLFSTKTLKPLGTLSFHTKNCKALYFAHQHVPSTTQDELSDSPDIHMQSIADDDDDDDEMSVEEKEARSRWLIAGSEDTRLSLWGLMDFKKSS